mgnify:CR=1 FL=1
MTKDMTQGSPLKLLLAFAVPLMLGSLFQQFYNLADTIIVGRFVGVEALAAVGSVGGLNYLVLGFVNGIACGFSIPISWTFGAHDHHEMRRYTANTVWLSIAFATVLTIVTVAMTRLVLVWTNTPADIIDLADVYIRTIFAGIPFTLLYNVTSALMRALGDSKRPLYFLLLSSVLNIVLDLVFIINFHWGCAGAAWATVISQGVSGVLCVIYIAFKLPVLRIRKEEWKLSGEHLKNLSYMGFPMGLQNSITAIGSVILSSAVNTLGSGAVAAMTAAGKVQFIFTAPYDSMGMTLATFAGQNLGARKYSRIDKGMRFGILSMFVYSAVSLVVLYFFGTTVALLFVSASETAILADVHTFLVINAATSFLLALLMIVRYIVQGIGYSNYALFAGLFEMVARTLVALILVPRMGFTGASLANPAAWIAANGFLFPCYFHLMKKIRARNDEVPDVSIE